MQALEQDAKGFYDTTALKRQKTQLEKGVSRLIDSYADDIIDKDEFEPKIKAAKAKITQIASQIDQGDEVEDAQRELSLIISRLEEFFDRVNATLETVDFESKRDIIRAMVKRVEIHKNEVVVVFRIDPELPSRDDTTGTTAAAGEIMQDCKRRSNAAPAQHVMPVPNPQTGTSSSSSTRTTSSETEADRPGKTASKGAVVLSYAHGSRIALEIGVKVGCRCPSVTDPGEKRRAE